MPRAQLIDTITSEILDDLGWFDTASQARTGCAMHARQMLVWERSPDDLWIAEGEEEAYHVEADVSQTASAE
ncbi:hypothetical protein EHF33_20425 (plasmid) [Deinococcus psychrotolerans]|uniref:Uncharacterized protein n=1 Tax=Deinococcus psychrotolerans TaxID=2489213 RepID=A0A3G8YJ31_9DEIO|nr:hypothetical protein [Deinococcus psychrotolerans]AZI45278.1 hypothetical protein EHF33_20425 [Deinococcus psychrotolerans]